jgi:AsmA protein
LNAKTTGDDSDSILKTLNGNGEFLVQDGAIKGIDLVVMVRNATVAFGLAEKPTEKPRTDFTELRAPFTINNGIFNTTSTTLVSPLLRLITAGNANLPEKTLNFRVEPKFVGTLVGQGDTQQRLGIAVPVLISGTFSSPKFRPDLKNIIQQSISGELPSIDDLKENIQKTVPLEDVPKILEEKAKDLLKNSPFGK